MYRWWNKSGFPSVPAPYPLHEKVPLCGADTDWVRSKYGFVPLKGTLQLEVARISIPLTDYMYY